MFHLVYLTLLQYLCLLSVQYKEGQQLCFVLAFDFCRCCVVTRFFHTRHHGQ